MNVANWHQTEVPKDTENVCSSGYTGSGRPRVKTTLLTRMRHHASFMMRAVPDTLIELPAISLISARISDRIPMSSP
jgi:hypothetical protein